jgi:hypothetical protein
LDDAVDYYLPAFIAPLITVDLFFENGTFFELLVENTLGNHSGQSTTLGNVELEEGDILAVVYQRLNGSGSRSPVATLTWSEHDVVDFPSVCD